MANLRSTCVVIEAFRVVFVSTTLLKCRLSRVIVLCCGVGCCSSRLTGDDSSKIAKPHRRRQARGLEDSAEEGDWSFRVFVRRRLRRMIDDLGKGSVLTTSTFCRLLNDGHMLVSDPDLLAAYASLIVHRSTCCGTLLAPRMSTDCSC